LDEWRRAARGPGREQHQLFVSNGGVLVTPANIVGDQPSSTNNRVVVDGGHLARNQCHGPPPALEVRARNNLLNSGLIDASTGVDQPTWNVVTATFGQQWFRSASRVGRRHACILHINVSGLVRSITKVS